MENEKIYTAEELSKELEREYRRYPEKGEDE